MDYWKECVAEAFEDAGIVATDEQIDTVTNWVDGAHENYGMAHGYDAIPSQIDTEVERLRKEIDKINEQYERQLNGVRRGVAQRRNVDVGSVYIDDSGNVTYDT